MRLERPRTGILVWLGLSALLPAGAVLGQDADDVKARYTKYEYRIPMRDGVKLFTSVYVPKDTSRTYPFLILRTPYSVAPYGVDRSRETLGPSRRFADSGYIFVFQDVRGRWMSEGEFVNMRPHQAVKTGAKEIDESTDTYDTIAWLLENVPGNNGRAGMWGISYPGFYTSAGIIDAHPALVAASPQAPICDWFVGDDFHHNGALFLPHLFNFIAAFGQVREGPTTKPPTKFEHGTPDGYKFFLEMGPLSNANKTHFQDRIPFWNEVMAHDNYDAFWQSRNLRPHLKQIKPAVLTVGGWFDAENLFGALETYRAIEQTSPGAYNILAMGPWLHGGWNRSDGASLGDVAFTTKTAEEYQERIEFPFFEHFLKGDPNAAPASLAEAQVFETGTNRWRTFETWPPASTQPVTFYLAEPGRLQREAPAAAADASDSFPSDPAKPVPFIEDISIGMTGDYMIQDQRFAARRPDVLVYTSEPLEADLTLAGPLKAELFVATTGTDADWIVKVIDVYPDDYPDPEPNPKGVRLGGYQQLVRGDVMRGRFRESHETPKPFEPGAPTRVDLPLNDVCHTFRTGHRVMVQIQSTWFPLVDRNPQQFVEIDQAKPEDFKAATHTVHRSKDRPSRIVARMLP